jgi:activator of HSP90 ATPase
MKKIIQQTVSLPAQAERLFAMYLDAVIHGAITGDKVTISAKEGSVFRAFDGMVYGKTIAVAHATYIVQLWRGCTWKVEDPDSILVLNFLPNGEFGTIELTQVNIPENQFDNVNNGWQEYYWTPWRDYLEKEQKKTEKRAA